MRAKPAAIRSIDCGCWPFLASVPRLVRSTGSMFGRRTTVCRKTSFAVSVKPRTGISGWPHLMAWPASMACVSRSSIKAIPSESIRTGSVRSMKTEMATCGSAPKASAYLGATTDGSPLTLPRTGSRATPFSPLRAMSPATCGFPPPMPSRNGAKAAGRFVDITPQDLRIQFASFLLEKPGFCGWDPRGLHCFIAGRFVTYPLPRGFPASSIWGAARDSGRDDLAGKRRWQASPHQIREGRTQIEPVTAGRGATAAYRDRNGHSWTFSVLGRLLRSVNRSFSGRVETVSFSSVYEDREGNLWLTTEGQGLCRLRSQSIRVYSREEGLIDRNVYPIAQDRSGPFGWGLGRPASAASREKNSPARRPLLGRDARRVKHLP